MGFTLCEKRVRRAGLDYWPWVKLEQHPSWQDFYERYGNEGNIYAFTKHATRGYHSVSYQSSDILVFGSETDGLPDEVYDCLPEEHRLTLPMACPHVRSLNLSNAVSVGLYEGLRSSGAFND